MSKKILHPAILILALLMLAGCQTLPNAGNLVPLPSPKPTPAVSPAPTPPDPALLNDGLDDALQELETLE